MREVLMMDGTGKTLWRFGSLTEAAYTIGISPTSVNLRIKRESVVNGVLLVYGEDRPMTEEERIERRNMLARRNYARKCRKKDEEGVSDSFTCEELERAAVGMIMSGVEVERVQYELKFGRVAVTPCRKRDVPDLSERIKVGSLGCVMCRYFKGRCRESKEVLCVFNHSMYTKGKKGGGRGMFDV